MIQAAKILLESELEWQKATQGPQDHGQEDRGKANYKAAAKLRETVCRSRRGKEAEPSKSCCQETHVEHGQGCITRTDRGMVQRDRDKDNDMENDGA